MKQEKSLRLTAIRQLSIGISIGIALIAVLAITAIASSTTLPDTQLEQGYTKESLEASSLTAPFSPAGPAWITSIPLSFNSSLRVSSTSAVNLPQI